MRDGNVYGKKQKRRRDVDIDGASAAWSLVRESSRAWIPRTELRGGSNGRESCSPQKLNHFLISGQRVKAVVWGCSCQITRRPRWCS